MIISAVVPAGCKPGPNMSLWIPRQWLRGMTGSAFFVAMTAMLLSAPLHAAAVPTPIYPILNDKGAAGNVDVWGPGGPNSVALDGTVTTPAPPEGYTSMKAVAQSVAPGVSWWATWAVDIPNGGTVDLTPYAATGEMRFWAWCSNDDFDTLVQHKALPGFTSEADGCSWAGLLGPAGLLNQWVSISCPASYFATDFNGQPLAMNDIITPFRVDMHQVGATCYFDHVRFVNPPSPEASLFTITVKTIANPAQQPGTISWTPPTLPAKWTRADQYIELQLDDALDVQWGVQIYTDNTNAVGTSKFTGNPAQVDPSGLVNGTNQTKRLPIAWSIKSSALSPAAAAPAPAEPNDDILINGVLKDPNAPQWLYLKDAQTKTIAGVNGNPGSTAYQPGEPFIAVKNNLGIHYSQGITLDKSDFGAENSPNYIYFEANFDGANTPVTYQTTQLIVEFYTP